MEESISLLPHITQVKALLTLSEMDASFDLSNGKIINAGKSVTGGIPPYRETQNYVRLAIDLLRGRGPVTTISLGSSKTRSEPRHYSRFHHRCDSY